MSKTSRKSLPAVILAVCLLFAQAALFSHASNTGVAHAAPLTGAQIYLNPANGTYGSPQTVSVRGTGFTPGPIIVTFNASYSADGSPLSPKNIPPTEARNGDNRQGPWGVLTSSATNTLQFQAFADSNGNLVTSGGAPFAFSVPQTAVNGNYSVTAVDTVATAAATQYTISSAAGQQLIATPVSGASAQLGGLVNVVSAPNSFFYGDNVTYKLESFTGDDGSVATPSGYNPLGVLVVHLPIVSCGTSPVPGAANPTPPQACQADINGHVNATVQLSGIYSTIYYDQVFAIVASNEVSCYDLFLPAGCSSLPLNALALPASGHVFRTGIHIDHGQTTLTLSTTQQSLSNTVTYSGTFYGAFATVKLYFITLPSGASCPLSIGAVPGGSFSSPCLLGTVTTDGNGAFTATFSLPNNAGVGSSTVGFPGYVLAEDFDGAGIRLNEAAAAALTINPFQGNPVLQLLTASGGGAPYTAAISSTVKFTATGYLANEEVTVNLSDPSTNNTLLPVPVGPGPIAPGSLCAAVIVADVHADATGMVTGSFLVPESCNTVTARSDNSINAGASVTVTAVGSQTGLTKTAALKVPATTAVILPVTNLNQTGSNIAVTLQGTGFAANEPVTFQFSAINPFDGTTTSTPVLSVSDSSDATGAVTIKGLILPGSSSVSTIFGLVARGLNSSFSASVSVAQPFGFLPNNGNLNCPTGNLLPGQPFVVSGTNFGDSTTISASINFLPNLFVVPSGIPTDASGSFSYTITVPLNAQVGTYQIVLASLVAASGTGTGAVQQLRACNITVGSSAPTITANPVSGNIGITTTVVGAGFAANEPIILSLQFTSTAALSGTDVPGTQQTVGPADANGNFTGIFTVKSSVNALVPGTYNLTATGANTGLKARTPFIVTGGTGNPATSLYFAEGYTGTQAKGAAADFVETLSILNANNFTTTYTVTYFIEGAATPTSVGGSIAANSVVERAVNTDVGNDVKVAAMVTSPAPLAANRVIARAIAGKSLDSNSSLGQQINSLTAPSGGANYYFAAGEVLLTNEEYLTILNPTSTAANVTINILAQGATAGTAAPSVPAITATVGANSRSTIALRSKLTSAGITRFGVSLNSNVPLAVERVEYYGDGIGSGKYGASTKAAGTSQQNEWIFAADVGGWPSGGGNASVGTGNDQSEVDIINPGAAAAGSATVTFEAFDSTGKPINSQQVQVDGGTRETINVNDVVGTTSDVFSVTVIADKGIFVEKPIYYGGDPTKGGTFAVATPSGSPAGLTSVALPYLDLTSPSGAAITQTVFLYNPGVTAIQVRGIYVSGSQSVAKTYQVNPNSITTVSVNADAATLPKGALGGIFQVVQTGSGNSDSFVAMSTSNSPDFKVVVGNQGTYPVGAVTNP